MVSFDPFTAQLMANNPQPSTMESTSPLTTPQVHAGEDLVDIPVGKAHITQVGSQSSLAPDQANQIDWHEFDGAECCDLGSSVSGLEPEAFHIIPLLPVDGPTKTHTASVPNTIEQLTHQNRDYESDSRPSIIKHPSNHTCSRCGLLKASSVHHSLHPVGPELQSVPLTHRHGRPSHCLSTIAPDIEAATLCPDIESPTSPGHNHKGDPFEVYMDHERHHLRQGRSHLVANFSADSAAQELDFEEAGTEKNETSSTEGTTQGYAASVEDNGEGTRRHHADSRFRNERIRKAREQLLFENEKVEKAVRAEIVEREFGKPSGLVEIGVVERED